MQKERKYKEWSTPNEEFEFDGRKVTPKERETKINQAIQELD